MSCIVALQKLINNENTIITNDKALAFQRKKDSNAAHMDWDGAFEWFTLIKFSQPNASLRNICREAAKIYVSKNELLLNAAKRGRETLKYLLEEDELQVFEQAHLFDETPECEVAKWWHEFKMRKWQDKLLNNSRQGLLAEFWQMEQEAIVTKDFGHDFKPVWDALNRDDLGYDIRSYRVGLGPQPMTVLIEVKSYASTTDPTIYITRNEWQVAQKKPGNYLFAVWCIELRTVTYYNIDQFEPSIPEDRCNGSWEITKIYLG